MKNRLSSIIVDEINHELKSPLATIKLCTDILQRQINQSNKSISNQHLEKINSKVDYLTQLINDYTDLLKIQNSFISYNETKISLEELISRLCVDNQVITVKNNVTSNPILNLDFDRLNQVIQALTFYLQKNLPQDGLLCLSINSDSPSINLLFFGIKNSKDNNKLLKHKFDPKLDLSWRQVTDFKICTSLASEYFNHYHGNFFHFYHPKIGIAFQSNLPLFNKT